MSTLTLSLLGMYNQDETILNSTNFVLPEDVDRSTLVPMLLTESAELEILYPAPEYFKVACKAWSTARCPSWEKMFEVLEEEYDPLHNYDRTETETGSTTGTDSITETETVDDVTSEDVRDTTADDITVTTAEDSRVTTAEDITDTSSGTTSTTATGQVTGFNSNTFADNNKTLTSGTSSDTTARDRDQTETTDRDTTETTDRDTTVTRDRDVTFGRERETGRTGSSSGSHSRTLRTYGNIGVMTSQSMAREELELRKIDIYRLIVEEFIYYFCLRVY